MAELASVRCVGKVFGVHVDRLVEECSEEKGELYNVGRERGRRRMGREGERLACKQCEWMNREYSKGT